MSSNYELLSSAIAEVTFFRSISPTSLQRSLFIASSIYSKLILRKPRNGEFQLLKSIAVPGDQT